MSALTATEPALIGGLLDAAADELPDQPALVCGEERLTYGELRQRVAAAAGGLAARGVGPGDPVALLLRNGPAFVEGFLALARLGAVAVPLNPRFTRTELDFCFTESGVRTVIDDRPAAGPAVSDNPPPRFTDRDAIFQYSGGATGRPKRVPRTHRQLVAEADAIVTTLGLGPADTIACPIPLFHTYGMGCGLLAAIRSGATLALLDDALPLALARRQLLEMVERTRATVLPAVPFVFRALAESDARADLSSLRLCFSAANALPREVFEAFDRVFGIPIRQIYGCTEAGALTANLDDDPWATAGTVGAPIAGVRVDVLDRDGEPVDPGRIGEVAVRSPAMTRGYAGVPDAVNRASFPGGAFLTGDRGRIDEAGRLVITGRRKRLIDVRGDKVDPIEVEDVLAVHPRVREVVVVGAPSGVAGEHRVKAVVVPDGPCGERELVRFCRERLAAYKVPQLVDFRDEIPRSSAGEVLHKYLL